MDYYAFVEDLRPSGHIGGWTNSYEIRQRPRVMFSDNGDLYSIMKKSSSEFKSQLSQEVQYISSVDSMKRIEQGIDELLSVVEDVTSVADTLDNRAQLNAGRKVFVRAISEGKRIQIVKVK